MFSVPGDEKGGKLLAWNLLPYQNIFLLMKTTPVLNIMK